MAYGSWLVSRTATTRGVTNPPWMWHPYPMMKNTNAYKVIQMHNSQPLYNNGCDNIRTPSSAWFRSWPPMTSTTTSQLSKKPVTGVKDAWTSTILPTAHRGSTSTLINKRLCLLTIAVRGLLVVTDHFDAVYGWGCVCLSCIAVVRIRNRQCQQ